MNCPHCNGEVPEGKQYCGHCGGKLAPAFDDDAVTRVDDAPFFSQDEPPKKELPAPDDKRLCPECGTHYFSGARFCSGCGANLVEEKLVVTYLPCPDCGIQNVREAKFCNACGLSLGGAKVITPRVEDKSPAASAARTQKRPGSATAAAWINILTGIDGLGIVAGIGILLGKKWGWWLGVVRCSLAMLISLSIHGGMSWTYGFYTFDDRRYYYYEYADSGYFIFVIIAGLMTFCLALLFNPRVREYVPTRRYTPGRQAWGIKLLPWIYVLFLWTLGVTIPAIIGLFQRKKWGWWVAISEAWLFTLVGGIMFLMGMVFMSEAVTFFGGYFMILFWAVALYLHRHDVRAVYENGIGP